MVLLPAKGEDLNWEQATAWAKEQGGELPSRPVVALLFTNVKTKFHTRLYWANEEYDASSAWNCYFNGGYQYFTRKSCKGRAVAVRLITITD